MARQPKRRLPGSGEGKEERRGVKIKPASLAEQKIDKNLADRARRAHETPEAFGLIRMSVGGVFDRRRGQPAVNYFDYGVR